MKTSTQPKPFGAIMSNTDDSDNNNNNKTSISKKEPVAGPTKNRFESLNGRGMRRTKGGSDGFVKDDQIDTNPAKPSNRFPSNKVMPFFTTMPDTKKEANGDAKKQRSSSTTSSSSSSNGNINNNNYSFLNQANQQAQTAKPPPFSRAPGRDAKNDDGSKNPSPPLSSSPSRNSNIKNNNFTFLNQANQPVQNGKPRAVGSFSSIPLNFSNRGNEPQQEEQLQEQSVQPAESSTIPTLTRWWQTSKGGITGFVEGNRSITTAPLARGTRPQKGQVIETQDGKLYRLD
jgi:hypothetical protein